MNESKDNKEIESNHLLDKLSVGAVSGRFIPIRFYITEFFCWVVCGIEFYKDYRRFYKGQDKGQSVP
jgi:hypothetical protein